MSEMSSYAPGTFCWVEVGTTDAAAASKFYTQLFGWEAEKVMDGPEGNYVMLRQGGKEVAGLYQMSPEQSSQGIPPHWLSYVSVADATQGAKKAASLGGKVIMEAFDVMDVGRMALVQDPTGAMLALWQPKRHIGARLVNEPASLCWNELATTNPEAARKFYTALFDWKPQEQDLGPMKYTTFLNGDRPNGGMLEMTAEWTGTPPHWMPYIAVRDCDRTVAKAQELGGTVCVPPEDIPNIGRFAVLQDPQGAVFSVIRLLTTT